MAEKKTVRIHNKSDKPDNVIKKENDIYMECESLEEQLPRFLRGYFAYLKGNVLPMTRLAYLHDVKFFMQYLIDETDLTEAENVVSNSSRKPFNGELTATSTKHAGHSLSASLLPCVPSLRMQWISSVRFFTGCLWKSTLPAS